MVLMKFIFVMLFIFSYAMGQPVKCDPYKSKEDRIADCRLLLNQAYKEALKEDQGLIHAQLRLTAYKIAKYIYDKNLGPESEPLKAFSKELLSEQLVNEANELSGDLQSRINGFYLSRNQEQELNTEDALLDLAAKYQDLNDYELSKILVQTQKSTDLFNQNDVSMLWFVSEVNQEVNNKESTLVSNAVKSIMSFNQSLPQEDREKEYVKNIADANLKLKGELYKIKNDVFKSNKCDCVGDYNKTEEELRRENKKFPQNNSIFLNCRDLNEDELINTDFLDGLHQILLNSSSEVKFNDNLPLKFRPNRVNSNDVRLLQDDLNSDKYSNKDRIVNYYKTGLYENNGECQSFTIVDKETQTTSIYSIDGEKIFETNVIMAKPRQGANQVVFNPDSELREFNNGSYSRSTSAGVFYSVMDMDPLERSAREYDKEFQDRVFVLGTRHKNGDDYSYDDKITIALHGVPSSKYISNAQERLASFDGGNRNLSTGCVNIEGYAFDMLNNLSQNHCPVYILPEDPDNYFHVKNRELLFSTSKPERKRGEENPLRCQGSVSILPNGEAKCNGEWKEDPNNINKYHFTDLSDKQTVTDYLVGEGKNAVVDELFKNKNILIEEVTKNNIDEEDYTDLVALTYALSEGQDSFNAQATFKDLYNAFYKLQTNKGINFERMSMEDKRLTILGYYQDPSGFIKDQGESYAPIITARSVSENVRLSERVRFIYDQ
jgi:hypothetical protein